jgi:xylan 1,4-beta-xylosidase
MKLSGLLFVLFLSLSVFAQNNQFTINTKNIVGENTEFWKAAGSDHLFYHVLKPSGQALLDRMEKHKSHKYMRSHHTFNQDLKHGVIRGQNVYSEDKNGNPVYDFSNLNKVFREYVKRGIKPYVEYDYLPELLDIKNKAVATGNDEGMTMRNTGPKDWKKWSDLMKAATQNFINEFGEEEVRTWYFEVWNEPDGWPVEQLDIFFKMYDVFVDAVTSVDPNLRVGGPACYHEYFLRPFFEHITNGTNYVNGEKGTRIDFISYHVYGLSGAWLNKEPHIQPQVQRFSQSVLWLQRLIKNYPALKRVPFHLNEWGMSSNYYRLVKDYPDLEYRNNHESALFLAKLVNSLYQIEDNYNFPTAILGYWGFVWEADEDEFFVGKRELTTAGNIPKPIQTGFELMAQLKEQRLEVVRERKDNQFGILATKSNSNAITFIAYNYEEDENDLDRTDELEITLTGLKAKSSYKIVETCMDKTNNNTYAAWQKMGSPSNSKNIDLTPLKKSAEISSTAEYTFKSDEKGVAKINLSLLRHSMKLIEITK